MDEAHLQYAVDMDELTLDALMGRYGQDVWNFAWLLTKSRSMADDIAQDVFLQAYRHVSSFRGEASVKTWLLKITRNISVNYRKSAFVRRALLVARVREQSHSRSAENDYMEREAVNEVWRHVFKLPGKYREVLVLHARYGLPLQQIAGFLEIPEGTVKSRLFHARKKLEHKLMEDEGYEPV